MKKNQIISVILFFIIYSNNMFSLEIDWQNKDKAVLGDIGIGAPGLSIGGGFRYWFASLSIGYAGIFNSIPNYSHQLPIGVKIRPNEPLPTGYRADSYTASMINIDFNLYYEQFLPFILTASIGYYSQADTVIAYNADSKSSYFYRTETSSGVCLGLGVEYQINDLISAGVIFHSKRGLLLRMTYFFDE